jgi:hypothetical protein
MPQSTTNALVFLPFDLEVVQLDKVLENGRLEKALIGVPLHKCPNTSLSLRERFTIRRGHQLSTLDARTSVEIYL